MVTVVENGVSGYVDTNLNRLVERMRELLLHPEEAHRLSANARRHAQERFNIQRFSHDWDEAFALVTGIGGMGDGGQGSPAPLPLHNGRNQDEKTDCLN